MRIMFLPVVFAIFFLLLIFRTFCSAYGWDQVSYTHPCVSDQFQKTNRLLAGHPLPCDIRMHSMKDPSRPITCPDQQDTGHTPRKLPRFHEQSPASSHSLHGSAQACIYYQIETLKSRTFYKKTKKYFSFSPDSGKEFPNMILLFS